MQSPLLSCWRKCKTDLQPCLENGLKNDPLELISDKMWGMIYVLFGETEFLQQKLLQLDLLVSPLMLLSVQCELVDYCILCCDFSRSKAYAEVKNMKNRLKSEHKMRKSI